MPEIQFRWMSPDEVENVADIDRTERIRTGYKLRDGQLQQMQVQWDSPPWIREGSGVHTVESQIDFCREHLAKGGIMYGAFDGDTLVGVGILTPQVQPGVDQLAFLHVSQGYRRDGIGFKIAAALQAASLGRGAEQLYVSATPSGSAVGFYLDFGFLPTSEPIPELYQREPQDIHMVKWLSRSG
jgi:GNAT superfamily N-acetyltransferase